MLALCKSKALSNESQEMVGRISISTLHSLIEAIGKRYLEIDPSSSSSANAVRDDCSRSTVSAFSPHLAESDVDDLEDWFANLSVHRQSQSTMRSQQDTPRLSKDDASGQKIVYGGLVSVDTDLRSPTRVTELGLTRNTIETSSESPTIFAPAPIRPRQTLRPQELWQDEGEKLPRAPSSTPYEPNVVARAPSDYVSNNRSLNNASHRSCKSFEEDPSTMLQFPSPSPRHSLQGNTPQATEILTPITTSFPIRNEARASPTVRSSRRRDMQIHERKLRDLQRTRLNIGEVLQQSMESAKVPSLDDTSVVGRTQPIPAPSSNTTVPRRPRFVDTNLVNARSSNETLASSENGPANSTSLMGQLSLSPVMLVAEVVPLPKIVHSSKTSRLASPERPSTSSPGPVPACSWRAASSDAICDAHVFLGAEDSTQDRSTKLQYVQYPPEEPIIAPKR
ncbi:MAG: hypothetical protein Q9157_002118 [Trypethelium eluteriae]